MSSLSPNSIARQNVTTETPMTSPRTATGHGPATMIGSGIMPPLPFGGSGPSAVSGAAVHPSSSSPLPMSPPRQPSHSFASTTTTTGGIGGTRVTSSGGGKKSALATSPMFSSQHHRAVSGIPAGTVPLAPTSASFGGSYLQNQQQQTASTMRHSGAHHPMPTHASHRNSDFPPSRLVGSALDRRLLPTPLHPVKCPVFCCFYAEFDIKVGPKVCFQSPEGFMERDIAIPTEHVHDILADVFNELLSDSKHHDHGESDSEQKKDQAESDIEPPRDERSELSSAGDHENNAQQDEIDEALDLPEPVSDTATDDEDDSEGSCEGGRKTKNIPGGNAPLSIFDSTSDYIITGNELADQILCLSTHNMHILARPTIISDSKRYERNSLLFSVGFVLRRAEDPRPFRPLLSTIAQTLHAMEVESHFLSSDRTRPCLQRVLTSILVSLNSRRGEANLLLDEANHLNLKLFKPPRPVAPAVPDHAVPVLLRPEWQLQLFGFDLCINWIVPHIDGLKHARLIALSSEVDAEMVRASLRVLRHHGVLALVDIFRYSNVYECTPLASAVLSGQRPRLLGSAYHFAVSSSSRGRDLTQRGVIAAHLPSASSVGLDLSNHSGQATGSASAMRGSSEHDAPPLSTAAGTATTRSDFRPSSVHDRPSSRRGTGGAQHPLRQPHITVAASSFPPHRASPYTTRLGRIGGGNSGVSDGVGVAGGGFSAPPQGDVLAAQRREQRMIKAALAQLYCACQRNTTFGEILLSKMSSSLPTEQQFSSSNGSPPSPRTGTGGGSGGDGQAANRRGVEAQGAGGDGQSVHGSNGQGSGDVRSYAFELTEEQLQQQRQKQRIGNEHPLPQQQPTTVDGSSCRLHPKVMNVDWRKAIKLFDHRRFITFGIIYGLIRRVHNFPVAYEVHCGGSSLGGAGVAGGQEEEDEQHDRNHDDTDEEGDEDVDEVEHLPQRPAWLTNSFNSAESPASAKMGMPQDPPNQLPSRRISSPSRGTPPPPPPPPFLPGTPPNPLNATSLLDNIPVAEAKESNLLKEDTDTRGTSTDGGTFLLTKQKGRKRGNDRKLAMKVASSMDGTKCDDELSCLYGKSISELVNLVKSTGKLDVMFVYSPAPA